MIHGTMESSENMLGDINLTFMPTRRLDAGISILQCLCQRSDFEEDVPRMVGLLRQEFRC